MTMKAPRNPLPLGKRPHIIMQFDKSSNKFVLANDPFEDPDNFIADKVEEGFKLVEKVSEKEVKNKLSRTLFE